VYSYVSLSVCVSDLTPLSRPRNAFEALKRHLSEDVWSRQGAAHCMDVGG